MKTKIFMLASVVLGLSLASCNDDDNYFISTDPVVDASSIATGSSDVTANSATLHATVKGLDDKASSFYSVGFYYGEDQNNLSSKADGRLSDGVVTAEVNGLMTGVTYYYQAFVTLKGQVSFLGDIKSFVTTNATVSTEAVQNVDFCSALMGGSVTEAPADATVGVVIATAPDTEAVRAGLVVPAKEQASSFSVEKNGLMSSTTYYYAAYLNIGAGIIYGDVKTFTTAANDYNVDDEFVDLGLSVKWAKSNLGARSESDFGGHFGFGDASGINNSYLPEDYAAGDIYKTHNDIAWQMSGGKATLPSYEDYEELFSLCQAEWVEVDGVQGYRLTGPNGNSIFLPAAGSRLVNDVTGEGASGIYATGSANPNDNQFYYAYQFSSSNKARATLPVYQAVSVRPISVARNVPFVKSNLYTKWYMDNGQDGKQHVFEGPYTQFGVTDNWNTVTNNYPNLDQNIHWEMGTTNGWIGYTYGKDYGYMEFFEDGTFKIHRIAEDGTVTDETGTYSVDENDKTITIDIDILHGNTWIGTKKGKLNILALDNDGLRIALPDGDYGYAINYYSERKREFDDATAVTLQCTSDGWSGIFGAVYQHIASEDLAGKHTISIDGACPNAMVFYMDFANLVAKYPDVVVYVNEIRFDGQPVKFDSNKLFYGDIEEKGHYRIEFFNIWGKGGSDNKVKESPFSTATNVGSEPAVNFSSKLEIDYTIILTPTIYTPAVVNINPSWDDDWAGCSNGSFTVKVDDNNKIAASSTDFDILLTSTFDHTAGSIMTFVDTPNLYADFPTVKMTLTALEIDGNAVTGWDHAKVVNAMDGGNHRLELWNMFGTTSSAGCAFGTPVDGNVKELGFTQNMRLKFTIDSILPSVEW